MGNVTHPSRWRFLVVFRESLLCCVAYDVEVDEAAVVLGALEQGAALSGHGVPGSVEVVGHDVDHVQGPAWEGKAFRFEMTNSNWLSFNRPFSLPTSRTRAGPIVCSPDLLAKHGDLVGSLDVAQTGRHGSGEQETVLVGLLGVGLERGSHLLLNV